ncbi:MAG: hypothetical protein E6J90_08695 [Deltaproteobacteria bacterium]|nr:MAG: hypothetical protein E6J90_08695 [Deltaproteobacteria bacterium]
MKTRRELGIAPPDRHRTNLTFDLRGARGRTPDAATLRRGEAAALPPLDAVPTALAQLLTLARSFGLDVPGRSDSSR